VHAWAHGAACLGGGGSLIVCVAGPAPAKKYSVAAECARPQDGREGGVGGDACDWAAAARPGLAAAVPGVGTAGRAVAARCRTCP
jgi:hypothetical protein